MMKKISVVILHYKGIDLTRQCLLSLQKIKEKSFSLEVVVIDNYSPDSLDDLKKEFKKVIFIRNKKNLGFAEGNNVGIREALKNNTDDVLLLNNDTIVDKDFLQEMLKTIEVNSVGIVAPKIYFAPGYEYHQTKYKPQERGKVFWYAGGQIDWQNILCSHQGVDEVDEGQYSQQQETDFASGCCMLIKKEVFDRIGLFDKRYFLYLEDVEFCRRAELAGFKIFYQPKAKIWHFNASSSQVGGDLHDYFITRNRLLFGMKYASWRTRIGLFRESFKLAISGRRWQRKAIRDFYQRRFGKGSYEKN